MATAASTTQHLRSPSFLNNSQERVFVTTLLPRGSYLKKEMSYVDFQTQQIAINQLFPDQVEYINDGRMCQNFTICLKSGTTIAVQEQFSQHILRLNPECKIQTSQLKKMVNPLPVEKNWIVLPQQIATTNQAVASPAYLPHCEMPTDYPSVLMGMQNQTGW